MSGLVVTQNPPRFAFYSIEELLKKTSSKEAALDRDSVSHGQEVLDFSGHKKGVFLTFIALFYYMMPVESLSGIPNIDVLS